MNAFTVHCASKLCCGHPRKLSRCLCHTQDREESFRTTSEDTNSHVLWWAFAQTFIFVSVGLFQVKHLKDFFITKKIV